ncbi:hypothetical protein BC937DRAFT_92459 [Endogone sp. FLAS-F59071]|nr:hypothetical protein BC937DRAFT_92459 [Endogone sp. FLAS-F59071]|eukprot:RUS15428.1 hypothetical protein BC937DRAFT_92459 [Endogone sp. FLAS-F59071]
MASPIPTSPSSPIPAVDSPTQEAHQTPPRRTSASPSPLGPNVIQLQHVAAAKLAGKSNVPTTATGKHLPSTTPPINVFSNDGSFLERFKKMKQDEDERLKREEAMRRVWTEET